MHPWFSVHPNLLGFENWLCEVGIGGPQAARFGSQSSSEETQRSNEFAPHEAGAIWRGYDSAR
jgi:hypothetical protein